jgi:UDP-glucose 4-epimerase
MASVFIVGASGYIGLGIATAFRRAGWKVFGLVRSEEKAAYLRKLEIIPVIGDQSSISSYREVLCGCSVIVDAIGFNQPTSGKFLQSIVDIHSEHIDTCPQAYTPLFIFTSGIMTYGSSDKTLDESVIPQPKLQDMKERKLFEDRVLNCTKLRTVVVRPGFVYGGSGGVVNDWFFNVQVDADLELFGSGEKRWSWVHVDDLGEGYLRIAQAGSVVDHQVFNLGTLDAPRYEELRVAMAKQAGWDDKKNKIVYKPLPTEPGQERWATFEGTVVVSPAKAMNLLEWQPKHLGYLSELDVYYQSYKACKNSN